MIAFHFTYQLTHLSLMYLQRITDVSTHNTTVASQLILENKKLEKQKQDIADQKDCSRRDVIQKLQKNHAAKVQSLHEIIKQKEKMISDVHDMAVEVSSEYHSLERKSKKTEASLKVVASNRLEHSKQAKQRENDVRESMDSIKESYEEVASRLSVAQIEIESLTNTVDTLQTALANAEKEIAVSTLLHTITTDMHLILD